jgi:hypothetical protein
MSTNYDKILPEFRIANLVQIEQMKAGLKIAMLKKLIGKGELEVIKIGNKLHIARTELIRYLEANTVPITTKS